MVPLLNRHFGHSFDMFTQGVLIFVASYSENNMINNNVMNNMNNNNVMGQSH